MIPLWRALNFQFSGAWPCVVCLLWYFRSSCCTVVQGPRNGPCSYLSYRAPSRTLNSTLPGGTLHPAGTVSKQQVTCRGTVQLQTATRENHFDVVLYYLANVLHCIVCMNGSSIRSHTAVMAPPPGLQSSTATTSKRDDFPPSPPFGRSATAPGPLRTLDKAPSDRSRLAPEDAFFAAGPSRRVNAFDSNASGSNELLSRHLRMRSKDTGSRSRSRRRKRAWKKLLWVKQSCEPLRHLYYDLVWKVKG